MLVRTFVITTLFTILLAGCNGRTVLEKPILVDRQELIIPKIQPVRQSNVKWTVITSDNAEQKLKNMKNDGVVRVIALTPKGYQTLIMNIAELRRYIQQQSSVIAAYQEYYRNQPPEKK